MSRTRHPSAWRPDLALLAERLAADLRGRDSPWPDVGAAAVVARGLAGERMKAWAAMHEGTEDEMRAIEEGQRPHDELPGSLRRAVTAAPYLPSGKEQPMLDHPTSRGHR